MGFRLNKGVAFTIGGKEAIEPEWEVIGDELHRATYRHRPRLLPPVSTPAKPPRGLVGRIWDAAPKKSLAVGGALTGAGGLLDMLYPDDRGYAPGSDLPWSQKPRPVYGKTGLDADGKPLGKVEQVKMTPEELAKKLEAMGKAEAINWE